MRTTLYFVSQSTRDHAYFSGTARYAARGHHRRLRPDQALGSRGDLRGIVKAIDLSRHTMRNIRQNLFFALAYNAVCVPLAAGVLYPLSSHLLLIPMIAAAAMSLGSVSVVTNALRQRSMKMES